MRSIMMLAMYCSVLERLMRLLIVIVLLVGAAFMVLFMLADLARDLSRRSFMVPPDLDSSDEWDIAADEFADTVPQVAQPSDGVATKGLSLHAVNPFPRSSST
jgi:multisubunit Na+/H+ antiporter MnhC subunit